MKHLEKIILILLAIGLMTTLNTGTAIGIIASGFTLISGCYFFYRNSFKGLRLLTSGQLRTFLLKSLLPFLIAYAVALVLNVFYGLTYVENSEFQLGYLATPFAHKETALLPVLYGFGLCYGYLRNNKKAIKITLAGVGFIIISGAVYINLPADTIFRQDENYREIEQMSSLETLVNSAEFKDKTVYIDLWYSSCGPCIDQFKNHLGTLKRDLEENNLDVAFVYLGRETSHPDSRQRWHRAIEKYELKGWHYYFSKDQAAQLWKEINTGLTETTPQGYPHYLVAKNGKIISYRAPRPEGAEALLKLLQP